MSKPISRAAILAALMGRTFVPTAQAAREKFVIDDAHAYPFFGINHLGWSTTRSLFRKITGTATLDFFDAANFPEATFESKGFRALDAGRYEVGGTLTLKGVSRDLTAPLTLKTDGSDLVAGGQFELKRLDFNVGDGPWADTDTVANEVQIKFELRLKPVDR